MSKKPKVIPYDPSSDIGPKKKRGIAAPYFELFLALLPIFAGTFAGWAMINLHLDVTAAVIAKAALVGVVVAIVSYAINRFAVDWGTELAAGGYGMAGAFSVLSMMVVAGCLWFFSFGGIVLPDVRTLRFEDHGIALSQNLQLRQEQAAKAMQVVPVIAAARDDLAYHAACEVSVGCLSNRGGGAGPLSRVLAERSLRAGAIAEQLDAGQREFASIIARANELLGEYQSVLNDDTRSQKLRRQELIRIDGAFVGLLSGLEQAVPVGLIAAYGQELLAGVTIANRPEATQAVNALLRKHGQALQSVLGGIERGTVARTQFPGKAGLSDTLDYVGNFAPLAGVIWVAEGIFPLALWIYTWLFLIRQRERAENGIGAAGSATSMHSQHKSADGGFPVPENANADTNPNKRRRRRNKGNPSKVSSHLNGASLPETNPAIHSRGEDQ